MPLFVRHLVKISPRNTFKTQLHLLLIALKTDAHSLNWLLIFQAVSISHAALSITQPLLKMAMDKSTHLANVTLLCVVNGFFTIAGILLNSVVILCFLKASHLRKRLCYFMIFVLTCFDLGVVSVCHPLTAITAYIWSTDEYDDHIIFRVRLYSNVLYYFSFLALLTMNIDRFLAIKHPFFHKKSVTKTKLKILLLLFLSAAVTERVRSNYRIPR